MMMDKRLITGVMLSLSLVSGFAADSVETGTNLMERRVPENGYGIVPMPYEVKSMEGNPFVITQETVLVGRAAETKKCAAYLQQRLRKSCGLTLRRKGAANGKAIVLVVFDDAVAFSENDAYRLESSADGITIAAKTGSINDKPSMDRMRGLHVDIARHFRTKEELLKIIDSMAMHKLNTLHLHLTDVQGWRVEIKAYPKLTTVGGIGNKSDPEAPANFLTQEEVKEICAFAKSRYISIIPEIDMPGHMGAAIRAYPELNHPKDVNNKGFAIRGDAMARDFVKTVPAARRCDRGA
jgi:hexosaminidase